jgi:hypothetical protein
MEIHLKRSSRNSSSSTFGMLNSRLILIVMGQDGKISLERGRKRGKKLNISRVEKRISM